MWHTLPYPVLKRFFKNDSRYDQWLQTDLLLESAPEISVPKMEFYKNELQSKIAKVEQSKISLDRAVQNTHDDEIILDELSQVLLTHDVFAPANFEWSSTQGIISESISLVIFIILIILIGLIIKVHQLAAIVATLAQTIPPVASQILGATRAPIRFEFIPQPDPNGGNTPRFLSLSYIDDRLQYFIFLLIVLIAALYLLRRTYYSVARRCLCNKHGSIILQCVHRELCINFSWIRVPSSPANYTFSSQGPLTDLQIHGHIHPFITFSFPGFSAIQKFTNERLEISTSLPIPFLQAIFLRYMLNRPDQSQFHFYVLSQYRGVEYALPINDLSPPPNEAIYSIIPQEYP